MRLKLKDANAKRIRTEQPEILGEETLGAMYSVYIPIGGLSEDQKTPPSPGADEFSKLRRDATSSSQTHITTTCAVIALVEHVWWYN